MCKKNCKISNKYDQKDNKKNKICNHIPHKKKTHIWFRNGKQIGFLLAIFLRLRKKQTCKCRKTSSALVTSVKEIKDRQNILQFEDNNTQSPLFYTIYPRIHTFQTATCI